MRLRNFVALAFTALLIAGCGSPAYVSQKAGQEFLTDGEKVEWQGRFQIPDGENFALGVSHSKNYLYIAINSIDRDFRRQIARGGLTLWLDVKGGKRENLGIKFEGMSPQGRRSGDTKRSIHESENYDGGGQEYDRPSMFEGDLNLVVMDTKKGKSLGPADLLATINSIDETLFIEYQIPLLLLGEEFSLEKLGLGLESSNARSGMSGGRPGGMGAGGRGGGMSGGMGAGGRGGGRPGGPPSGGMHQGGIEVWLKVAFPK